MIIMFLWAYLTDPSVKGFLSDSISATAETSRSSPGTDVLSADFSPVRNSPGWIKRLHKGNEWVEGAPGTEVPKGGTD